MKYDLAIVGGGVLGLFHAYHALEKGLKVVLFEQNKEAMGSSVQNFGQAVPSGLGVEWQKYGIKSTELYKKIQSEVDISIAQNGSIYIASNEEELTLIDELHQINKENSYYSEMLTQKQCLSKYPNLKTSYCKGGLYFPQEVSVNPRLMVHRLQSFLQKKSNYTYLPNTQIQHIEQLTNQVELIDNSGNKTMSSAVIVCSGSEFKALYSEMFKESPLELVKLQMMRLCKQPKIKLYGNILTGLTIRRYESFAECPSFNEIKAKEDQQSFHKQWGIHILFKQESDGSIIIGDSHEYFDVKNSATLHIDNRQDINEYFINEAKKIMNLDSWAIDCIWNGYYSQTKQKDIFIHNVSNNIQIITGIGGKGMTSSAGFAFHNLKKIIE